MHTRNHNLAAPEYTSEICAIQEATTATYVVWCDKRYNNLVNMSHGTNSNMTIGFQFLCVTSGKISLTVPKLTNWKTALWILIDHWYRHDQVFHKISNLNVLFFCRMSQCKQRQNFTISFSELFYAVSLPLGLFSYKGLCPSIGWSVHPSALVVSYVTPSYVGLSVG